VWLEGLGKLKNPPHPGLEPSTFRLVAQCLNQLRYRVEILIVNLKELDTKTN
jgi:hypothetical protein